MPSLMLYYAAHKSVLHVRNTWFLGPYCRIAIKERCMNVKCS